MAKAKTQSLEVLLEQGVWEKARTQIERELKSQPSNHWLLTQLGVTYYEEGKYRESLTPLLDSLKIVPDCPLTLWNVAGALDAIGKTEIALAIYSWLAGSKKTVEDDSCWESAAWTDSLKTDCIYRIGVCFQHLKRWQSSEHCFRQYINLILEGSIGTYSIDDAARYIRELRGNGTHRLGKEFNDAIQSTLKDAGIRANRGKLPKLALPELLAT